MIIILLKLLTSIFCTSFLFLSFNKFKKGIVNSCYIVYLGFYFFMVLPNLLDLIIGRPSYDYYFNYNSFWGFSISGNDFLTEVIYSLFLISSTIVFFLFGIKKPLYLKEIKSFDYNILHKLSIPFLTLIIFLPTILSIIRIKSQGELWLKIFNYNFLRVLFRNDDNFLNYYYLSLFVVLSFVIVLVFTNKNILSQTLMYSIPVYIAVGIHGKRNIIAILLVLYLFVLLFKTKMKLKNFRYIIIASVIVILMTSFKYQSEVRGISIDNSISDFYTDFRVDYGRDDVIKMAIYYQINGEGILKNQMNTFLYPLKFIPLNLKGIHSEYKYSVYATSKLLGYDAPVDLGWGMTTGIFDEGISNFGILFGISFSLIIIIVIFRIGDRSKNSLIITLTYITGFLVMILQLTSFIFILLLWLLVNFIFYLLKYSKIASK